MKRLIKYNFLLKNYNNYLYDSLLPLNINYFYNFGSLLGLCLIIQIVSGIFLAMFVRYGIYLHIYIYILLIYSLVNIIFFYNLVSKYIWYFEEPTTLQSWSLYFQDYISRYNFYFQAKLENKSYVIYNVSNRISLKSNKTLSVPLNADMSSKLGIIENIMLNIASLLKAVNIIKPIIFNITARLYSYEEIYTDWTPLTIAKKLVRDSFR